MNENCQTIKLPGYMVALKLILIGLSLSVADPEVNLSGFCKNI